MPLHKNMQLPGLILINYLYCQIVTQAGRLNVCIVLNVYIVGVCVHACICMCACVFVCLHVYVPACVCECVFA